MKIRTFFADYVIDVTVASNQVKNFFSANFLRSGILRSDNIKSLNIVTNE